MHPLHRNLVAVIKVPPHPTQTQITVMGERVKKEAGASKGPTCQNKF